MGTSNYNRVMAGRRSRAVGDYFEQMIIAASAFYEEKGISVIEKTPEPMKVLGVHNRKLGQFICCFSKRAQPDFKGALADSTMILFDAKHTDKDRIQRDVITEEQEKCFERYRKMGAVCFVVVSIGFENYYRVPWEVFRDMKGFYKRFYLRWHSAVVRASALDNMVVIPLHCEIRFVRFSRLSDEKYVCLSSGHPVNISSDAMM